MQVPMTVCIIVTLLSNHSQISTIKLYKIQHVHIYLGKVQVCTGEHLQQLRATKLCASAAFQIWDNVLVVSVLFLKKLFSIHHRW